MGMGRGGDGERGREIVLVCWRRRKQRTIPWKITTGDGGERGGRGSVISVGMGRGGGGGEGGGGGGGY